MRILRRAALLVPIGLILAFAASAFLGRPSKPAPSRVAPAATEPETPVAGSVETAPPTRPATPVLEPSILARFGSAKESRDWAQMRDLRLRCAEMPPEQIRKLLSAVATPEEALLLAELMEDVHPRLTDPLKSEIARAVRPALERASLERSDRATVLRLLGLFGGQESVIVLLQTDPRADVRRDAALALGETGTEAARPQLQVRARGADLAGLYAIWALEGMRKRGAILVSCEVQGEWRERLEQMLEDEAIAAEALGGLAFLHETSDVAVMEEILRRPIASESAKRRALRLLGRVGAPEDLEGLSVPASLESDLAAARAEILSRERGCEDSRRDDE